MDVEHLAARDVLHADLVEVPCVSTETAAGPETAHRLLCRQRERRLLFCIVYGADNDWPIRVALEKLDDDFLADARNVHCAPRLACPAGCDSHPTRAVLVLLADAIPVELHLHAA